MHNQTLDDFNINQTMMSICCVFNLKTHSDKTAKFCSLKYTDHFFKWLKEVHSMEIEEELAKRNNLKKDKLKAR